MATRSTTTYTHTCDFCGAAHPRADLRGFGRVEIADATPGIQPPEIEGKRFDVCPDCRAKHTIEELDTAMTHRPAQAPETSLPCCHTAPLYH
jgi:hypothetical protein